MTDPAVTSGMATVDALAALPLPETLSGQQRDGHICVWGGEALTSSTAVDLGSRPGEGGRVFPRACPRCTSLKGQEALYAHAADREACDGTEHCPTCRALYRVIRLGRR